MRIIYLKNEFIWLRTADDIKRNDTHTLVDFCHTHFIISINVSEKALFNILAALGLIHDQFLYISACYNLLTDIIFVQLSFESASSKLPLLWIWFKTFDIA